MSALAISYPLSRWGRKRTLIALAVPAIVGFLLMGFTVYVRHKSLLYLGRILTGLLVGAATPAAQIYVMAVFSVRFRVSFFGEDSSHFVNYFSRSPSVPLLTFGES